MRFLSLLALIPLLQAVSANFGGAHPPYCGTTVVTKTHMVPSITKAPAVTKTLTKDKQLCFTTETKTAGATVTQKVKETTVSRSCTNGPRNRRTDRGQTPHHTRWAPAVTATKTRVQVMPTCGDSDAQIKRSASEDHEDAPEKYISNAERLRRGLPLNKPEKRHFHPGQPDHPGPSCVPSTSTSWVGATQTKTVTPTHWTTTTKCRYTHTVDKFKTTTATELKTKTVTKTIHGQPTTVVITKTPTSTEWTVSTSYHVTGACRPTTS